MADMPASEFSDAYPLARYEGQTPAAPDWFRKFIATPCSRRHVIVDGAKIAYQQWGDHCKPGLLLVHGGGAHSHWYDFIAPAFGSDYNVVAMNFSGMGDSDWRSSYNFVQYSSEQMAVMRDAGFFDHETKPVIAAHSLGGVIALTTASKFGGLLGGVVTMDTPVFPPEQANGLPTPRPSAGTSFPDKKAALSRFRLLPPQPCDNHYVLDHIARYSLKEVERDGGSRLVWKFDPTLWKKIGELQYNQWNLLPAISCNLAFIRGEWSMLLTDAVRASMLNQVNAPFVTIQRARHHVFLDNPLDTIAALGSLIGAWSEHDSSAHIPNTT